MFSKYVKTTTLNKQKQNEQNKERQIYIFEKFNKCKKQ